VLTPIEVLTRTLDATEVTAKLGRVPGIATVARSTAADSNRAGTTVLLAIPRTETVKTSSLAPVGAVRDAVRNTPGVLGVAGDGAIELDYATGSSQRPSPTRHHVPWDRRFRGEHSTSCSERPRSSSLTASECFPPEPSSSVTSSATRRSLTRSTSCSYAKTTSHRSHGQRLILITDSGLHGDKPKRAVPPHAPAPPQAHKGL
jgi:hypothetical protein